MPIFKVLHILSMFAMVTTQIGGELVYASAISRRDVRALASVHRVLQASRIGIASIVALASGVVFGLLTAATGGFDFLGGWLIAAYLLVAVFLVTGSRLATKLVKLGDDAVEAEAGGRPAEDVIRDMIASRALLWFAVDAALVVVIIVDMVLKPF
jgi:uncharacterized membrane protein